MTTLFAIKGNFHTTLRITFGQRNPGGLTICTDNPVGMNARNGTRFSRCGVSPGPNLSRLEKDNDKTKWRLHLRCQQAGKEAKVNRVELEFTIVQEFSGHFGWNRKTGIRLRISSFSETLWWNELYHCNF